MCKMFFYMLLLQSLFIFFCGLFLNMIDYKMFMDWNLISLNSCNITMSIFIDMKCLLFISFVLFISSMVMYYSNIYMNGDGNLNRFIIMVLMFVFSMLLMIISPNLVSILLGWDGLGLVSYCLVIYYQNIKSYNAGMLTALSNRVGDVALLLSIALMMGWGSWNYIFIEMMHYNFQLKYLIIMVIVACMTKSAQIPFSSWLPAAMAAPTPVSSLVHSSTLVTAGIYVLIRFGKVLEDYNLSTYLLFIGTVTMLMAGIGANFEFDLKKIIALSTLSQLGVMMFSIGLMNYELAYFHLLSHALFKALLFLCAGVIIHGFNNLQDIRGMGSIIKFMPLTSVCFLISNLALCGMPFLSGFYSKDLILEMSMMSNFSLVMFILVLIATGMTVCYTFRLIFYVMLNNYMWFSYCSLGDENFEFVFPMFMLSILSIIGGSILSWVLLSNPYMICMTFLMKISVIFICLVGGWLGLELSKLSYFNSSFEKNQLLLSYFGSMWFLHYLSTQCLIKFPLKIGFNYYKTVDNGWSEEIGPQGIYNNFIKMSRIIQLSQDNFFKSYLMSYILWIIVLVMCL
uniref:NADH-ubiquinone oxidoreductase chain 5 n=1 Tax=Oecanthus sinensis TaxID=1982312 RepID=A0A1W6S5T1_9ORTH|nr:NADH dehydrogenase subunit 5 [Oecanthus sinensis]ARO75193.1 NADH dehydrogenase subunit 5 [Oecanthus sinensis]